MYITAKRTEDVWNSADYALIKPVYSVSVFEFQPTEELNVLDWSIKFLIRKKEYAFEEVHAFNEHFAGLKGLHR